MIPDQPGSSKGSLVVRLPARNQSARHTVHAHHSHPPTRLGEANRVCHCKIVLATCILSAILKVSPPAQVRPRLVKAYWNP
jgi:hypothetical protein